MSVPDRFVGGGDGMIRVCSPPPSFRLITFARAMLPILCPSTRRTHRGLPTLRSSLRSPGKARSASALVAAVTPLGFFDGDDDEYV